MHRLLDPAWWRSIATALLRTALASLVPFVPALAADPGRAWQVATLTVALTVVLAVANALRSLPDLSASPWWEVALQRALRQFGQVVVTATAGAAILTDVHWLTVLQTAGAAAISTLVLAALAELPARPALAIVDAAPPVAATTVVAAGPSISDGDRAALTQLRGALTDLGTNDATVGALDRLLAA